MGFRRVLRYKQSRPAAVVTVEPPATDFGMYRPHWQGYGTDTVGGRGPGDVTPTIVVVNTLEDNNDALGDSTRDGVAVKTGSFRSACALDAPRFVTFEVSGTIDTTSLGSIMIEHSYITIAGQTAPAGTGGNPGGINIKGKGIHIRNCSHVVLQHLRIRLGDGASFGTTEGVNVLVDMDSKYVVVDHCSLSFTRYMAFSAAKDTPPFDIGPDKVALLDTIIAYGLREDISYAGMAAGLQAWYYGSCTMARNLFVHNSHRIPAIGAGWRTLFANNIVYGSAPQSGDRGNNPLYIWGHGEGGGFAHEDDNPDWAIDVSAINNHFVSSAGTGSGATAGSNTDTCIFFHLNETNAAEPPVGRGDKAWLDGNVGPGITGLTGADQWDGVVFSDVNIWPDAFTGAYTDVAYPAEPSWVSDGDMPGTAEDAFSLYTAAELEDAILPSVGARATDRDQVDTDAVSQTIAGIAEDTPNMGRRIESGEEVHDTIAETTGTIEVPSSPFDPADVFGRTNFELYLENLARTAEGVEPLSGTSTVSFIGSDYASEGVDGGQTIDVTLANVAAGDAIVVVALLNGNLQLPVTFTDTKTNTYGTPITTYYPATGQPAISMSYVLSAASGSTTITATLDAGFNNGFKGLIAANFRTSAGSFALDDSDAANDNTTTAIVPTMTASTAGVAFGAMSVFEGGNITPGAGWSQVVEDETFVNVAGSLVYRRTAAGSYTPTWGVPHAGWAAAGLILRVV